MRYQELKRSFPWKREYCTYLPRFPAYGQMDRNHARQWRFSAVLAGSLPRAACTVLQGIVQHVIVEASVHFHGAVGMNFTVIIAQKSLNLRGAPITTVHGTLPARCLAIISPHNNLRHFLQHLQRWPNDIKATLNPEPLRIFGNFAALVVITSVGKINPP